MNLAQKRSLKQQVEKTVRALNPHTLEWDEGEVTGTYAETRLHGDVDLGLYIDFGTGPVAVNQKYIDL